jgi:hypothetical protein
VLGRVGPRWAERQRSGWGKRRAGPGVEGARPDLGVLGSNKERARIGRESKGKRKWFLFLKNNQPNEFKYKFEFKDSKTMHQHVCNSKLLYFII